eukprot:gnl/TRDRNA2_/TRDRNA2_196676_c0_seq1.p1 gnl/TRDRNA2_/TRDRNA2_196676_c0~~gnl/TRDRNA2_/TRDRNA2_196676_c0_seq1.p1  ORF type:complete len:341 (+),score=42.67 gnl/TRDRNA2_/TRDRNA2_196676_c0_seq1:144-1166(+)
MEEDTCSVGWPGRAACRWVTYSALWSACTVVSLLSAYHSALRVAGALLGLTLCVVLPLLWSTLFETTYGRQERQDMVLICFPCFGVVVICIGVIAMLQAAPFIAAEISSVNLASPSELCERYAGQKRESLPRTVCLQKAFVKTDWEAGKLRCVQDREAGHVKCVPAFTAAPIFDDKARADAGLPEEVRAWAVSRGQHVDANYRPDGQLCGYLKGRFDFDFYIGDYNLAVSRVIQKHHLSLGMYIGANGKGTDTPLPDRPMLMTADPMEATSAQQGWLLAALILLCLCPCAGPGPIGALLVFFCWARGGRHSGRHVVGPDDEDFYDDDDRGPLVRPRVPYE